MNCNSTIELLMIEDNPADIELTLNALQKNNLANHIFVVQDGEEALEYIFCTGRYVDRSINSIPKVILLDIKLPKVSGIEILRRIRGDERTKYIPVVVLTSSKEEKDIIDSYELHVNSYIVKPIKFENFAKTVSELGLYWLLLNQPPII